jgi:uncharacterized protein YeaO (DUF488 family)
MRGQVRNKRWNDAEDAGDGARLLVCRYRPRGVRKEDETWSAWDASLGPSRELHAAIYGKHGAPIAWREFKKRYLAEMRAERDAIDALAARVAAGETITLLCSSACTDPSRCHRTLLAGLIEKKLSAIRSRRRSTGASASPRSRGSREPST